MSDTPDPDAARALEIVEKWSGECDCEYTRGRCERCYEEGAIAEALRAARDEGAQAEREAIDVRGLSEECTDQVRAAMAEARKRMYPVGASALATFARLFCDAERARGQQDQA